LEEVLFHPDNLCAEVNAKCRPLAYFEDYLKVGYYPFRLEGNEDYYTRIENVVNMIMEIELPQQCGIDVGNVRKLKTLLTILSSEVPLMVDMTKLSALSEMSRTTLLSYLQYLHRAKLINLLYSDLDSLKKLQKPDKIYMENPNLLYALSLNEVNKGTVREVFMVNQLAYQHRVEYCTRSADYTIDRKYVIETGGKSKDGKQIAGEQTAFIASDNLEFAVGNKIPLWAFGFLY
jgi:predicted AAA+ superfamily ATPase